MSGICATLKGLVLIECKAKPEMKGQFKSWVIKTFPKSYKTATRYMRLAEAFGRSDSTVTFNTLTRDLSSSVEALKQFQLDLSHPAVAAVAKWVAGRGAYQLMLDFPADSGGSTGRTKKTPAEQYAQFLQDAYDDFTKTITSLDGLVEDGRWKAPTVTDAMLEESVELAREFARQATAWLKLPKKERIFTAENTEVAES